MTSPRHHSRIPPAVTEFEKATGDARRDHVFTAAATGASRTPRNGTYPGRLNCLKRSDHLSPQQPQCRSNEMQDPLGTVLRSFLRPDSGHASPPHRSRQDRAGELLVAHTHPEWERPEQACWQAGPVRFWYVVTIAHGYATTRRRIRVIISLLTVPERRGGTILSPSH